MAATAFQDYYATLGVPKTATQKEIKAAFRKLARTHHPDLNANNPDAERRFKEINEAHEVLGDPEKRKRYDEVGPRYREYEQWERAGRPGPNPFAGGAPGGFATGGGDGSFQYRTVTPEEMENLFGDADPFSDFFHSMFGRAGGGRTRRATVQRRGEDVEGEVAVTLEEAYAGTTRTVEMSGPSGTRRVEVRIPAGIGDGALVRAAGQGGAGSGGGSAGDLHLRVRVTPHPRFQRDGADLRCRVPVPLDVALLGGDVAVPTLRGTTAQLHVPAGTQNGARLRLRGLGMPRLRGGTHGDLYAEVDVRLPATVSPAARELAEQLRRERLG